MRNFSEKKEDKYKISLLEKKLSDMEQMFSNIEYDNDVL